MRGSDLCVLPCLCFFHILRAWCLSLCDCIRTTACAYVCASTHTHSSLIFVMEYVCLINVSSPGAYTRLYRFSAFLSFSLAPTISLPPSLSCYLSLSLCCPLRLYLISEPAILSRCKLISVGPHPACVIPPLLGTRLLFPLLSCLTPSPPLRSLLPSLIPPHPSPPHRCSPN